MFRAKHVPYMLALRSTFFFLVSVIEYFIDWHYFQFDKLITICALFDSNFAFSPKSYIMSLFSLSLKGLMNPKELGAFLAQGSLLFGCYSEGDLHKLFSSCVQVLCFHCGPGTEWDTFSLLFIIHFVMSRSNKILQKKNDLLSQSFQLMLWWLFSYFLPQNLSSS